MNRDTIMVIHEKSPFQDGLVKLIDLKFGLLFKVLKTDTSKLQLYENGCVPKLIILEKVKNPKTVEFLIKMRNRGSKLILVTLEATEITELELNLFNAFLVKNMRTSEMLKVMEDLLDYKESYVHPDFGDLFLKKLINA
ncbi:hypothetical protein NVV31_23225 [Cytobacillus firmus]|uniref:hypothetical protein n=1 Tax=Cytobacillus firmus TaxID=1399 RepID=UPI0021C80681|nr:hypothetical protein [Cytobacillus firmus]MCU1808286.1 hypothetical protein [Cytobacillus firmus]